MIPLFIFSQKEESKESKLHRYWAQQERKKATEDTLFKKFYFKNELSYYVKGEKFGEFQKPTYQAMIRSCNDIIKIETEDSIRRMYYDTINQIQDKMESLNILENITYKSRISWYSKGTKPNREKIDSILIDQFVNKSNVEIDMLRMYYNNLYFLYQEKNKEEDLERIFIEYMGFITNDSISSEQLKPFSDIFKRVYHRDMILKSENLFWKNYNSNKKRLVFIMDVLEENKDNTTSFYKNTLDSLIKIEPTHTNYFKLASYHKRNNDNISYEDIIDKIKIKFPQFKDEFNYNDCVELFNDGKYMLAYKLALQINGKYKGEALKIAAMSVSSLASQSGTSTFERKCNYYYAIQLLEKAKQHNTPVSTLISQYKSMTPNTEEKFEEGNPATIKLTTWNVTVSIN
jgi:hypothetical protein